MSGAPPRWTIDELSEDATTSAGLFRAERLSESGAWALHYKAARQKFKLLFDKLGGLDPGRITDQMLAAAFGAKLGEPIRYLAGPPISDDDLQVIAEVESLASGLLSKDADAARKVFGVIERVIDPFRFPWIRDGQPPSRQQREAALLASAVLLAAQRVAAERRNVGKAGQETKVREYLLSLGYTGVVPKTVNTLVQGPQAQQFCGECLLGERKADIVLRLHDTRPMAIECKVSNSAINSVKPINNDAAAKAEYWLEVFGTRQLTCRHAFRGLQGAQSRTGPEPRPCFVLVARSAEARGFHRVDAVTRFAAGWHLKSRSAIKRELHNREQHRTRSTAMNPQLQPVIDALIEARISNQPAVAARHANVLAEASEAQAVQSSVAQSLGWFDTVPLHWKSGGPSRDTALTHAPLPPAGVWSSPARPPTAFALRLRCVEAEVALRLARDVDASLAPTFDLNAARQLIDAMTVSIEVVESRWCEGLDAPPLLRLADQQSHGALVLGPWVPFDPGRDWSTQRCKVRIGDALPREYQGTHSLADPCFVVPQWLRHATRDGVVVRAGSVVTTGTWCGVLQAQAGDSVAVSFEGIGEARIDFAH